jgi:uncharacterized membrane protein
MNKKRFQALSAFLIFATLAVTLAVYQSLPDSIPVHWNIHGQVDRYGPRIVLFADTLIMTVFMLVAAFAPSASPANYKVEPFEGTFWYLCLAIIALLAYIQMVMLAGALYPVLDMSGYMAGGIVVFLLAVGNVMGKVRPNFWMGIRTPWTLADERVWYATHRLAAKTMVGASLLALVALRFGLPFWVVVLLPVAGAVVPAVYSFVYFKRYERSNTPVS